MPLCSRGFELGDDDDSQDVLSDSFFNCKELLFWSREERAAADNEL